MRKRLAEIAAWLDVESLSILIHRLRTDESERPSSVAAIWRHLQPNCRTPSAMMASSEAVHMARPWSKPRMHSRLAFGESGSDDSSGVVDELQESTVSAAEFTC